MISSAQNSAEKVSADALDHTPVFEPAPAAERAVVDISELCTLVRTLSCSHCKQDCLSLAVDTKRLRGLAVYALVYCSTCEQTVCEQYLASRGEGGDGSFVINRQILFPSLVCGLGASMLNNFCENMDLQGLHHKTFHQKAYDLYKQLDQLEQHVLSQTVQFVCKVHAEHFGISLSDDDVLDISMSFDGTWLTRGHDSHIGVGCVVDLLTGMCVDAYVMCIYCQICELTGKALYQEKTMEYAAWLVHHIESEDCRCDKNFTW